METMGFSIPLPWRKSSADRRVKQKQPDIKGSNIFLVPAQQKGKPLLFSPRRSPSHCRPKVKTWQKINSWHPPLSPSQSTVTPHPRLSPPPVKYASTLVRGGPSVSTSLLSLACDMEANVTFRTLSGTQYQVLDVVGEGAYGIVCSAVHRPSGRKVAIKKIAPFDHSMFCLRTLRELKLLKFLSEAGVSENIISILDIIKPSSLEAFKEVYLIQELMETDMHRVIRTQDLSDDHAQYFIYQTLRALKALHSADVIHRDLKPSNLLLNANCDLKVCDFGLARSVKTAEPSGTETGFMTEYVATRWYRAPEIMLTFKQYTKAIDVWSVGCILAEMLSGKPLFPGRDYHHQLTLILDVLGTPTLDEFYAITTRRSRDYIRALPFRKRRPFAQLFPNANPSAVDFLTKTLTFDPKKRITVEEALAHPYLEAYHDPDDEPVAPPLDPEFFEFDLHKDDISREQLKELLYEEIMSFRPAPIT
ncbi:kinase-like domain-containing protein [Boletus reticuloceps]|uniref:Mitogen-activated protein kinase n=1 Tax=Boletus reticuloceps TaxID=495285 RepID=A0A8I2YXU3_9AGAM|nr:kinase-like domain-containing protein [Boletus reticuloceps]